MSSVRRWLGVAVAVAVGIAIFVWAAGDEATEEQPLPASGTTAEAGLPLLEEDTGATVVLTTDGEIHVLDVDARRVETLALPQLSGGDPPLRLAGRGDRFVFWGVDAGGYATYVLDPARPAEPELLDVATVFIPSAEEDRVWLVGNGANFPQDHAREVDLQGRVTSPDAEIPGGYVHAATSAGLVVTEDARLKLWRPGQGTTDLEIDGAILATAQDRVAACHSSCRLPDVRFAYDPGSSGGVSSFTTGSSTAFSSTTVFVHR